MRENIWIALRFSLEFVPNIRINNFRALVQIMVCWLYASLGLSELKLLRQDNACMPQWTRPALALVMVSNLFGSKPLLKPVMTYCQLYLNQQIANQIITILIKENVFVSVFHKMAVIVYRSSVLSIFYRVMSLNHSIYHNGILAPVDCPLFFCFSATSIMIMVLILVTAL